MFFFSKQQLESVVVIKFQLNQELCIFSQG